MFQASVLIVGVGGLGSVVATYLAAAGIGNLRMADADIVSLHNLQRQVLYREEQIGKKKVTEATKQLNQLNSTIKIEANTDFFTAENAVELIKNIDIVIDATDNCHSRYLINDICVGLDKPFIYGAISEFIGQVAVFNYKQGATYRCLFPNEQEMIEKQEQNKSIGVLGVLPGVIGCLQANEAIKLITGYGEPLVNKLFSIDLQCNKTYTVSIPPIDESRKIAKSKWLEVSG